MTFTLEQVIALVVALGSLAGTALTIVRWASGELARLERALNEQTVKAIEKFATWEHVHKLDDDFKEALEKLNGRMDANTNRILEALAARHEGAQG